MGGAPRASLLRVCCLTAVRGIPSRWGSKAATAAPWWTTWRSAFFRFLLPLAEQRSHRDASVGGRCSMPRCAPHIGRATRLLPCCVHALTYGGCGPRASTERRAGAPCWCMPPACVVKAAVRTSHHHGGAARNTGGCPAGQSVMAQGLWELSWCGQNTYDALCLASQDLPSLSLTLAWA